MSFAFVTEFPIEGSDRSTTNYDAINDRLAHEQAPAGLVVHYAGFDEEAGVFRVVNLWDTREQGQDYLDNRILPAVREVLGDGSRQPRDRARTSSTTSSIRNVFFTRVPCGREPDGRSVRMAIVRVSRRAGMRAPKP